MRAAVADKRQRRRGAPGIVGKVADAYISHTKRQATRVERTAAMLKEQRVPKLGCHLSYAMAGKV